jgi:hypothetical protein
MFWLLLGISSLWRNGPPYWFLAIASTPVGRTTARLQPASWLTTIGAAGSLVGEGEEPTACAAAFAPSHRIGEAMRHPLLAYVLRALRRGATNRGTAGHTLGAARGRRAGRGGHDHSTGYPQHSPRLVSAC